MPDKMDSSLGYVILVLGMALGALLSCALILIHEGLMGG